MRRMFMVLAAAIGMLFAAVGTCSASLFLGYQPEEP